VKDPHALDHVARNFVPLRLDTRNGRNPETTALRLPRNSALLVVLGADGKTELLRKPINPADLRTFREAVEQAERIGQKALARLTRTAAHLLIAAQRNERLEALVDRLASERFEDREAANKALREIVRSHGIALARIRTTERRPEVRSRLDALLARTKGLGPAVRLAEEARRGGAKDEAALIRAALKSVTEAAERDALRKHLATLDE